MLLKHTHLAKILNSNLTMKWKSPYRLNIFPRIPAGSSSMAYWISFCSCPLSNTDRLSVIGACTLICKIQTSQPIKFRFHCRCQDRSYSAQGALKNQVIATKYAALGGGGTLFQTIIIQRYIINYYRWMEICFYNIL